MPPTVVLVAAGTAVYLVLVLTIISLYRRLYHKVGANEVLVISGGRGEVVTDETGARRRLGYRVVKGGGALVNPMTERVEVLSIGMITIDLVAPELRTRDGAAAIDAVAQVKVGDNATSICLAAEQFLSKSPDEVKQTAGQIVMNHLRAGLDGSTVEQVRLSRYAFAETVAAAASRDLANVGMKVVSLSIREIREACPHAQSTAAV
jgi:flotillin